MYVLLCGEAVGHVTSPYFRGLDDNDNAGGPKRSHTGYVKLDTMYMYKKSTTMKETVRPSTIKRMDRGKSFFKIKKKTELGHC